MAIQMRRGQEVNFDADKMLPGEWAVSLDTKYVRMCFAPGVCVRMATYDAFEVDMAKVEAILAECQTIEEVVTRINTEVSTNAQAVAEYTSQAKQYRDEAEEFRNQAEEIVGYGYASKEDAGIIRGGDNYIDENGTLVLTRTTTERELIESQNGGIRIISMDGESQQATYSGKNLYDEVANNVEVNHSGIKFTKNEYGNLTLSGTTTASINAVMNPFTLPAGTYYYQKGTTSNVSVRLYNRTASSFIAYANGSFTLAEESSLDIRVQSDSGSAISGTIKVQIEEGSTMTEYEPYVGGIASPNPNYPQSIDSVEISEISSHGKNLWNLGDVSGTRYVNKTFSLEAGTYTISAVVTSNDTDSSESDIIINYDDGSTVALHFGRNTRTSRTVTLAKPVVSVNLYASNSYANSANDTFTFADIQIEKGSVATDFEEFKETRETLSAPIVLRGIGDVKDVLCKHNGMYGVARKYIPFVIDGTQDITRETADVNGYRFRLTYALSDIYTPASMSTVADIMSDKFTASKWTDIYYGRTSAIGTNVKQIGWFDEKFKNFTVAEMKAWLTENPISGFYRLATPTFEPLPLADQIALHKLETFGGVTYLFTDSTIEPIIEVEYGTSKVGGYAIKGLNNGEISLLELEQLKTLTNELATQIVAGSEA